MHKIEKITYDQACGDLVRSYLLVWLSVTRKCDHCDWSLSVAIMNILCCEPLTTITVDIMIPNEQLRRTIRWKKRCHWNKKKIILVQFCGDPMWSYLQMWLWLVLVTCRSDCCDWSICVTIMNGIYSAVRPPSTTTGDVWFTTQSVGLFNTRIVR